MRLRIEQHNVTATQYNVSMFRIIEKTSLLFGYYSKPLVRQNYVCKLFSVIIASCRSNGFTFCFFPGIMLLLFPSFKVVYLHQKVQVRSRVLPGESIYTLLFV